MVELYTIDNLDKRIMYELDLNARLSASQLARRLRKSKETINFRLNRLIKNKLLKGFYTLCNTSKLGWYYIKFYIKFKNMTPEKEKEFFDYLSKRDNVAYLASTEGRYDCILLIMVKSSSDAIKFQDNFMKIYGEFIQERDIMTFLTTHRINQTFLYNGPERKDWFYPIEMEDYNLDETNEQILNLLSTNSRISLIELAERFKLDPKTIKYRLNKLEKDQIILAYVTSPNFDKLGFNFFQLNISLKDTSKRREIIKFFKETSKCLFAIELIGKYDLLVELHTKDYQEIKDIINEFRKKFILAYNDYDLLTINKEYIVVWGPFFYKQKSKS